MMKDRSNCQIALSMTERERAEIAAIADAKKMSINGYIRNCISKCGDMTFRDRDYSNRPGMCNHD